MLKKVAWLTAGVALMGGLAYPKLKPVLPAAAKSSALSGERPKPGPVTTGQDGRGGALRVSTFRVEPTVFTEIISSTGTVRADEGVELQAETNGKVISINFTEGTPVKKGDLLLKLNDSDLRANLDRYNYSKQLAEVRFRRYAQLFNQKVVTQDDYDSALSEMNVQQSFIDFYKAEIAKTEIRAPFDGVVGLRFVSVGAFVTANTRIATLQRLNELKIDFAVAEKYAGRIKVGSEIQFSVAGGFKRHTGRIYALDPRIDSGTRTLLVRAICPNTDGSLLPGAFTNVLVPLEQLANAVLIPAEAVIPGLDEKNVFVMKDGVAEQRAVEIGARTATLVHILSGLLPGDQIITSGLQQMRAKQPVEALIGPGDVKDVGAEKEAGKPVDGAASAGIPSELRRIAIVNQGSAR